jgi:integrase
VKKPPDRKQRRYLTIKEITKLGQTMREAEAAGENATALVAIRLMLLTGLRRMEALALDRASVDCQARCIRFKDTKSGAQLRPIGAEAMKLIEAQSVRDDRPWVFPASRGDGCLIAFLRY